MNTGQLRPVKSRRGVVTLECSVVANFGERFFEVLVSVPGTDGTVQAAWPMTHGQIAAPQVSDMMTYIGAMVTAAIWGSDGVQEVLPL